MHREHIMYFRRGIFFAVVLLAMGATSCRVSRQEQPTKQIQIPKREMNHSVNVELLDLASEISDKVGVLLSMEYDNIGLYAFVADWLGTPYRFGANTQRGTDCSGFVQQLFEQVYNISVGRTSSAALMDATQPISKDDLKEGDLVFFNINNRRGGRASHVGVYLKGGKFAHATTKRGVIVSHLSEPYYKRTYLGAGRVLTP